MASTPKRTRSMINMTFHFTAPDDAEYLKGEALGDKMFMGHPLKAKHENFTFKPFKFEILKDTETTPLPRSGHRIVCEEGNLYSFGGYLEKPGRFGTQAVNQQLFEELWELNSMTNNWRHLVTHGKAPKELASHSMLLHGHFLVVFGGTGVPFGGSSSNKMHVCDLRTLTWHRVSTSGKPTDFPMPQYGQAVVMDRNDAFYVVGGTTGYDYSIDVHKLDMKTFVWKALFIAKGDLDEPMARYRHEIALYNDMLLVLGGGTALESCELTVLPAFCLKTNKWGHAQTFAHNGCYPNPRKCHGYVRRGNDVYISGGYDNVVIYDDVWKLHLPTLEWTKLNVKMPVPTYFHATTITPAGCLFIYGGVTHIKNSTRSDQLYKVWLTIPSLKEMCWAAVHQYARGTSPRCVDQVIEDIPAEFKDRLPRKNIDKSKWNDETPVPPILPRCPAKEPGPGPNSKSLIAME